MKIICFIILFLVVATNSFADCFANCIFQKGTHCVNNACVPITEDPVITPATTPTPSAVSSEIWLDMVPAKDMVAQPVNCTGMDLSKFRVYLMRRTPPPAASFYSNIEVFSKGLQGELVIHYFFARKDILNRYVFILLENEIARPQFTGLDFAFRRWENVAFKELIGSMSCDELKRSGYYFTSGISIVGDRSDFEGGIFTFR